MRKYREKEKDQNIDLFRSLYLITLLETALTLIFNMIELFWCMKLVISAILGITVVMLIYEKAKSLGIQDKVSENRNKARWLIAIGYLVSLFCILLSARETVYELWMFGTVWIAFLVSPYMAVGFQALFTYLYCMINHANADYFVLYSILGIAVCGLSGYMKKKKMVLSAVIILISTNVTVIFLTHSFQFDYSMRRDMLYSIITLMAEIVLVMAVAYRADTKEKVEEDEKRDEKEQEESHYQELLNINFPLVRKIKERSKYLYQHSLHVSAVSGEAARIIGANEKIAQAGGLYHDIGKIEEGNYIENGKVLAEEYELPKELSIIIESCNVKYSRPKTVEAVIVMFADSIVASIEMLQVRHGDFMGNREAIIEKIFEVRFEDGSLDESGLTFTQYRALKKYFKEHDI